MISRSDGRTHLAVLVATPKDYELNVEVVFYEKVGGLFIMTKKCFDMCVM